jgi:hypothetical protein
VLISKKHGARESNQNWPSENTAKIFGKIFDKRLLFTCKNSNDIGDQDSGSTGNKESLFRHLRTVH